MSSKTLQPCLRRALKRWDGDSTGKIVSNTQAQRTSRLYSIRNYWCALRRTHSAALSRRLLSVANVAHHNEHTSAVSSISSFIYNSVDVFVIGCRRQQPRTSLVWCVRACMYVSMSVRLSVVIPTLMNIYDFFCVSIRSAAVRSLAETAAFSIIRVVYQRSCSQCFSIMSVLSPISNNLLTLYFIFIYTPRGRHFSLSHSVSQCVSRRNPQSIYAK